MLKYISYVFTTLAEIKIVVLIPRFMSYREFIKSRASAPWKLAAQKLKEEYKQANQVEREKIRMRAAAVLIRAKYTEESLNHVNNQRWHSFKGPKADNQ